ncbi:glutamyl-tRNA synthetase [Halarchaeum rubridurum]|uniref:Glutamate--tRNA ligase n=1 Tax=Halarchaeum rubridurum TaxID=489911 RepID=A0A830FZA5_9EURY|nr:glutamate--tRNA ligase [Halarchaeum rubridurum]MBP1953227.1 glutamyl-tRNA synthetase [Halarchaeum rubridurum]GGM66889.1 glutamate--tRNA ligase [Halarchaeum rubridurum]
MDEDLRERIRREAETNALFNALKHDSDAQVGAILGPLMGANPEFREHGDEVSGVVAPVVNEVNALDEAEKRARLEELAPERLKELDAEDEGEEHPLPDLPNAEEYDEVRMRCAPNPNGPWHLGHARMPAVIGTYKERYDGWMLVRFDDTDPETKRPDLDAYDDILADIDYLGFEPDEVVTASDRMETYYEHARELIGLGGAYTCSCSGESFSELKNAGEACPHREKNPGVVRDEFEAMIDGEYESGEMVLRVKTDIEHKNPALRDFVAFRMVDTPHPREEASDYRCWPMLDFQSGIDDHLLGITHIIRGIDLQDSAKRQAFVYDYFGWEYPEVVHWGHVQVDAYDVKMSTSTIKQKIEAGELDGWDDPRAPTLKSVRRRGIRGQAIVDAMVELGTSTSDVDLAMSSIYANNRDLIDEETPRAFLVRNGFAPRADDADADYAATELPVAGGPDAAHPPVHPNHEERGERDIPVGDAVLVETADLPDAGERVWLKGYGPVRYDGDSLTYTDDDIDVVREEGVDVIHWVPAEGSVPVRLRRTDGDVYGYAEPGYADYEPDDLVQFVRVGFARYDRADEDETVAYYAHQ